MHRVQTPNHLVTVRSFVLSVQGSSVLNVVHWKAKPTAYYAGLCYFIQTMTLHKTVTEFRKLRFSLQKFWNILFCAICVLPDFVLVTLLLAFHERSCSVSKINKELLVQCTAVSVSEGKCSWKDVFEENLEGLFSFQENWEGLFSGQKSTKSKHHLCICAGSPGCKQTRRGCKVGRRRICVRSSKAFEQYAWAKLLEVRLGHYKRSQTEA